MREREEREHQKGRLPRRHSAAASSFSGGRARLPPPPSAGAPLLPSGAMALSPPSLPQVMRARRPDPAAGKPDPVAGRTDLGSSSPSPPDPGAGEAAAARATQASGGGGPFPTAALLPFNSGSGVEAGSGGVEVGSGLPTAARHRIVVASCPHVTAAASMGPHRMLEHLRRR